MGCQWYETTRRSPIQTRGYTPTSRAGDVAPTSSGRGHCPCGSGRPRGSGSAPTLPPTCSQRSMGRRRTSSSACGRVAGTRTRTRLAASSRRHTRPPRGSARAVAGGRPSSCGRRSAARSTEAGRSPRVGTAATGPAARPGDSGTRDSTTSRRETLRGDAPLACRRRRGRSTTPAPSRHGASSLAGRPDKGPLCLGSNARRVLTSACRSPTALTAARPRRWGRQSALDARASSGRACSAACRSKTPEARLKDQPMWAAVSTSVFGRQSDRYGRSACHARAPSSSTRRRRDSAAPSSPCGRNGNGVCTTCFARPFLDSRRRARCKLRYRHPLPNARLQPRRRRTHQPLSPLRSRRQRSRTRATRLPNARGGRAREHLRRTELGRARRWRTARGRLVTAWGKRGRPRRSTTARLRPLNMRWLKRKRPIRPLRQLRSERAGLRCPLAQTASGGRTCRAERSQFNSPHAPTPPPPWIIGCRRRLRGSRDRAELGSRWPEARRPRRARTRPAARRGRALQASQTPRRRLCRRDRRDHRRTSAWCPRPR